MATLRKMLRDAGFDWDSGRIIYQRCEDNCPPGWSGPVEAREIDFNDPILDQEFDDGYGSPEMPRFIAEDDTRIYFPAQYDGLTWIETVYKDIDAYLDPNNSTPYPGGG